jgi:hypothetical protein
MKNVDFWFAGFFLKILEIYRLICIFLWVFGCFECVSSMFCLKLLPILNFTNTVLTRRPLEAFLYHRMAVLCAKEIHRLGCMDLKTYSLEKKPGP